MSASTLINEGIELFEEKKYQEAIEKFKETLDSIPDKSQQIEEKIEEQIYTQFWLGLCHLEQAIKTQNETEAKPLFEQAITHYKEELVLAEKLKDEQKSIEKQNNAQSLLGRSYFEQALKTQSKTEAKSLFAKAINHHQQQLELTKQLQNKQQCIKQQTYTQAWLKRCYLEQALTAQSETEAEQLFDDALKYYQQQLTLANEHNSIEGQINSHSWIGRCYLEQALKTQAESLFEKAINHHQQELEFAKKLNDPSKSIKQQIDAQFGLERCYLNQIIKPHSDQKIEKTDLLKKIITTFAQKLKLDKKLKKIQKEIKKQIDNLVEAGISYFEQVDYSSEEPDSRSFIVQAMTYFNEQLTFAQKLNKQESIHYQDNAHYWLGRCYDALAFYSYQTSYKTELLNKAIAHHSERLKLARQLGEDKKIQKDALFWIDALHKRIKQIEEDLYQGSYDILEQEKNKWLIEQKMAYATEQLLEITESLRDKQKRIEQQINIPEWIGYHYFNEALIGKDNSRKYFIKYLKRKAFIIKQKLFPSLKKPDSICTILALLYTPNHELRNTTLAHYTTANVAELLFGLNKKKKEERTYEDERDKSNMRMNSATYMNDPYEGKSLLEFLGKPEESLENITEFPEYNAFFSCFSSRVNDLNQFRLYGKEDGVEASGCCLVFNKNGDWLRESDITKSFSSIKEQEETTISTLSEKKYSLYQIAYLAYLDEYIDTAKYKDEMIKGENSKFAIYLPKIGNNDEWHKLRMEKLKEALKSLKDEINKKDTKFDQQALEYIRYLFKDFAFKDEEEFRMLTLKKLGEDTECCETTNSVFVEYGDISNIVDEVILGTNYEKTTKHRKVEVFRHKMIDSGFTNVKVTQSSLPINANPPSEKKNP